MINYRGKLRLLEIAQVPKDHVGAYVFSWVGKHVSRGIARVLIVRISNVRCCAVLYKYGEVHIQKQAP